MQAIQISWLATPDYHGILIYIVYFFVLIWLGLQFGLISLIFRPEKKFRFIDALFLSCSWVIIEQSRLYFISGFTWNPIGLALAGNIYSMQLATILGVYGLSFWVVLVNSVGYWACLQKQRVYSVGLWITLAISPYVFGLMHQKYQQSNFDKKKYISALLVQTGLYPEQKNFLLDKRDAFISPIKQWDRIISFIKKGAENKNIDLIVLPEAALPFGAYDAIYSYEKIQNLWKLYFNTKELPKLEHPFAKKDYLQNTWDVTNAYIVKAISSQFDTEVVIGLDSRDNVSEKNYNAAFYFSPKKKLPKRYEKQTLVPIGEYIPWQWLTVIAKKLHIQSFYTPGKLSKVFFEHYPIGISICVEETYPEVIRKFRLNGAKYFVNITNDAWFPRSRLPKQHFLHGTLRGVENGVPTLRACNTGVTASIDCFGRVINQINSQKENFSGAIHTYLPMEQYSTLYTFWGNGLIIGSCMFVVICYFRFLWLR